MTTLDDHIDRFVARLRARLAAGAREYGDRSFTRPLPELIDEIQQELEDVAGWGLIAWVRLEEIRLQVGDLNAGGAHDRT